MNSPDQEVGDAGFTWADAWFLLAVSYVSPDGEFATLGEVVAAADQINHAILTASEIRSATHRLSRDGWIHFVDGAYATTQRSIDEFSKLRSGSPLNQMGHVERWLDAHPYSESYDPKDDPSADLSGITDEDVDRAVAEYRNRSR